MPADKSKQDSKPESKIKPSKCKKCEFAGSSSNTTKFSQEDVLKFPKGFASENHVKTEVIKKGGKSITVEVTENITQTIDDEERVVGRKPVYYKIKRCPICGHHERVE